MFNGCLGHGYVPDTFGSSVIVPVPKGDGSKSGVFEGNKPVALISVMAKVFETCLMLYLLYYIIADSLKFGYVPNEGFQKALIMLSSVVDSFNQGYSDIFLASWDMSKAFDSVNHYGLYTKLKEAYVPVCILLLNLMGE